MHGVRERVAPIARRAIRVVVLVVSGMGGLCRSVVAVRIRGRSTSSIEAHCSRDNSEVRVIRGIVIATGAAVVIRHA